MNALVFLSALLIFIGIPSVTVLTIAKLRAKRAETLSPDAATRLDALERDVQELRHELGETQERLDFTERLLSTARDDRQIGK